jgi:hypothetical protein
LRGDVTLLPSGEKVPEGRMRGLCHQFLYPTIDFGSGSPLIRHAARATFSPKGRRKEIQR